MHTYGNSIEFWKRLKFRGRVAEAVGRNWTVNGQEFARGIDRSGSECSGMMEESCSKSQ